MAKKRENERKKKLFFFIFFLFCCLQVNYKNVLYLLKDDLIRPHLAGAYNLTDVFGGL